MRYILVLGLILTSIITQANDTTDDFQTWVPINTNVKFDENWRGFLELQPRFNNDSSNLGVAIVRPAIGYAISPNATFWAGYLMQATAVKGQPHHYDAENRIWQGFTWKDTYANDLTWEVRNRMEERFLPHNSDPSYRWRTRLRTEYVLPEHKSWSVIASEEVFVNLADNSNDEHIRAGIDQNRAYVGVGYRFTPNFQVESGYLNQHVWGYSGKSDQNNHVWATNVNLSF